MGELALGRMRKWMVFVSTFNILVLIGFCATRSDGSSWGDLIMIPAIIYFFLYLFLVLQGKTILGTKIQTGFYCCGLRIHKCLRAFLLLGPTVFILYVFLAGIISDASIYEFNVEHGYYNRYPEEFKSDPFACKTTECYFFQAFRLTYVITGLFVVIEIGTTLAWGSAPERRHLFGGANGGYAENANIILVSPDQPPYPQQQPLYNPQMQQQQQLYQQQQQLYQQPIVLENSTFKIDNNPQPQYPIQQQQQSVAQQVPYTQPGYSQQSTAAPSPSIHP
ncbi:hypothetical protein BGX29_005788 [Mortierella sp. GBA35]|nr:hypothetical protein BGX29_005788 [Mortierella sp. GBA35]